MRKVVKVFIINADKLSWYNNYINQYIEVYSEKFPQHFDDSKMVYHTVKQDGEWSGRIIDPDDCLTKWQLRERKIKRVFNIYNKK